MNLHELLKKLSQRASSTTSSPSQSKSTSRASSVHESTSPAAQAKYLSDPMRTSSHPDSVGHYVDPMGGRSSYHTSYDVTNTGA